jgi:hypothetical protein
MKKINSTKLESLDISFFNLPIAQLISNLEDLKDKYIIRGFSKIRIDAHQYYDDVYVDVYGEIEETEAERKERIKKEKIEALKERHAKEIEALKEKLKKELNEIG